MLIERLNTRLMLAAYAPDLAWGTDGRLAGTQSASVVGVHADRVYVTQTRSSKDSEAVTALSRFAADGTLDSNFQPYSEALQDLVKVDDAGRAMLFRDADQTLFIRRLARDGSTDARFGDRGVVSIPLTFNASVPEFEISTQDAAIAPDGSLYILVQLKHSFEIPDSAGSRRYFNSLRLIKLTPSQQLDTAFAQSGVLIINDQTSIDDNIGAFNQHWLGMGPSGRPIVGILEQLDIGGSETGAVFTRYTATGAIDPTYATNGKLTVIGSVQRQNVGMDGQGRLVVGQLLSTQTENPTMTPSLLRFDARGRVDRSFGTNGAVTPVGVDVHSSYIRGVVVRSDGVVSARVGEVLVRYHAECTPDPSFDEDGRAQPTAATGDMIGELSNGLLLTNSRTLNGRAAAGIARLAAQRDVSQSGSGAVVIYGTPGDDAVTVGTDGAENDYVASINGQQQTLAPVTSIHIETFGGNDTVSASFASPQLDIPLHVLAGDGNDTVLGTTRNDTLDAGEGDDSVVSGAGFDRIALGGGSNRLDDTAGGASVTAHHDIFAVTSQSWVNNVNIVSRGAYDGALARLIFAFTGSHAVVKANNGQGDTININASIGATVNSGAGDDTIISSGRSDDVITPSVGNDSVLAGAGNDIVEGEVSSLEESRNNKDYYDLGAGDDLSVDGFGKNTIFGSDGDDVIRGSFFGDSLFGEAGNDTLRGGPRADTLDGGAGRDRLYGYAGDDQLSGGSNNDVLVGGEGSDTLIGNRGNDLIIAGPPSSNASSSNTIDGGLGTDSALRERDDDDLTSVEKVLEELA